MAKIVGFHSDDKPDLLLDQDMLDREQRRHLVRFMSEIDVAVFQANREVIHRAVPELNRDNFVRFAVAVAEARARYVKLGLEVSKSGHPPPPADIDRLRQARAAFEELTHAFEATHRCIKRGYSAAVR